MDVVFTGTAMKQWRKLDSIVRDRIDVKLEALAATGSGDVKKLTGMEGARLHVGDWRVIYTVEGDTMTIHAVGHRSRIYE